MARTERPPSAEQILDLRALYDAAHEARMQRSVQIEQISAIEALALAELSGGRMACAFGLKELTDAVLWADLRADLAVIEDSQPMRASLIGSFAEFAERLATKDPVDCAYVAREILRRANLVHARRMRERTVWGLHEITLQIAHEATDEQLAQYASLTRVDAVNRLRYVEMYDGIREAFGLRAKAPMTTDEFAHTGIAMLEGVYMQGSVNSDDTDLMRPTGPHGEQQLWSMSGIMFEALVLASAEADPFAEFAIDLSVWR